MDWRRLLAKLQGLILERPRTVLAVCGLAFAAALLLGAGVEFRTSRSELAPEADPALERIERIARRAGAADALIACVEPAPESGAGRREVAELADRLALAFQRHPLVARVYYRIPLDWFVEHALYLVPPDQLEQIVAAVERFAGVAVPETLDLAELHGALAAALERALEEPSSAEGNEGARVLATLLDAELRFQRDPEGFLADLEGPPPLLALSGKRRGLGAEGYLSTRDGTKVFLLLSRRGEDDSLPALTRFVAAMRQIAEAEAAAIPGVRVAFTGQPAMTVEEMATVRRDTVFTSLVALGGVSLLTFFVFRWRTHVFLVLGALVTGVIWALGAVRLELGYLNMITSSFISTLIGVGVAYGIHPVSEYELEGAHTRDPIGAVREAYHRTGAPVTVAAVTTAAAFFSILLMRFRGFAELGLVAGTGILLCWLSAMIALPALLALYGRWRHRRDAQRPSRAPSAVDRIWVERAAGAICRLPRTITVLALGLTAWLGYEALDVRFSTNLLDLLPRHSEALEYQRRILVESEFSPVAAIVAAPNLRALEALAARASEEPPIQHFESVLDFIPRDPARSQAQARRLGRALEGWSLPRRVAPIERETLVASLRRLEEALAAAAEAAFGAGLADAAASLEQARARAEALAREVDSAGEERLRAWQSAWSRLLVWASRMREDLVRASRAEAPTLDTLPPEILERYTTPGGGYLAYLMPAEDIFEAEALQRYVEAARRVSADATGFPIVFHRVARQIIEGFYRSVAVGLLLVLLILILDFRKASDAALALLPVLLGIVWMLGWMEVSGVSFNFANLVAVPLVIGVGIDNGVHVLHRLRFEGEAGMHVVLRHTGRAILIASLTTMIGFGSLALAAHRGLRSLGVILLLGVGSCLVTAMVVLPNLLVTFGRARQ